MIAAGLIAAGIILLGAALLGTLCDRTPDTRRYPERPSTTVRIVPRVYDWAKAGDQ